MALMDVAPDVGQPTEVVALVEAAQRLDAALVNSSGATDEGVGWSGAGAYAAPAPGADPQLYLARRAPLPQALLAQYAYLRSRSFMGIFPEINRAWFSIDSRLFLWSYSHPDVDIVDYQAPDSQIIVSVSLVQPKPGLFLESIAYLLIVTTPVSIIALGVELPNGQAGPTCRFIETGIAVATDNTPMLKVVSLGPRIFMAGRDGALYELTYDRPASNSAAAYLALLRAATSSSALNARPRAKLINRSRSLLLSTVIPNSLRAVFSPEDPLLDLAIDNARNLLYTLSENGILTAYTADPNSESLAKILSVDAAAHARRYHPPREEARAMLAIYTAEAQALTNGSVDLGLAEQPSAVHLVLVTSLGERIYYSTSSQSFTGQSAAQSDYLPTELKRTLRPVGWRGSPPVAVSSSTTPVAPRAHVAFWRNGVLLLADARDADADTIVAVFPDASAVGFPLLQQATGTAVGVVPVVEHISEAPLAATSQSQQVHQNDRTYAKAWAMAEASHPSLLEEDSPFDPPREFVVLTNAAVHIYARLRPIDHLHRALARSSHSSEIDLAPYVSQYGPAEVCAMSIALALEYGSISSPAAWNQGNGVHNTARPPTPAAAVATAASRAFLLYGGEPHLMATSDLRGGQSVQEQNSTLGPTAGGRLSQRGGYQAFEVGRLVGLPGSTPPPVAFSPKYHGSLMHLARLVRFVWQGYITTSRDANGFQKLALSKKRMTSLRDSLLAFVAFVLQHGGSEGIPITGPLTSSHTPSIQEKLYHGLLHRRKVDEAQRFEAESTRSLIALARRASEALALLTILDEHRFHTLIPMISSGLREELAKMRFGELVVSVRGSGVAGALLEALFAVTADDSALVDALGVTLRDKAPEFFGDADIALHRGLAMIHQASRLFANQQLENAASVATNAVRTLKPVAERIFDLPTVCAELRAMGSVPDLVELSLAYADQTPGAADTAYACIFEALKPVIQAGADSNAGTGVVPTRAKEAAMNLAMSSKDNNFLDALFRSLISWKPHGSDELLRHSSPRIESFLADFDHDLLWRYYANHDRYLEASKVLSELSNAPDRPLDFDTRFNYIIKALHNSKAAEGNGDVLAHQQVKEMEDKRDVAQVQGRIRKELERSHGHDHDAQKAILELDTKLLGLSDLYNSYARPWQLWESELDALRCARYRDDALVQRLWSDLIEREISNGESPMSSFERLQQRVVLLGRDFYPSDIAFPSAWILHLLEAHLHQRKQVSPNVDCDWAWRALLDIGVSRSSLSTLYISLLEGTNIFDVSESSNFAAGLSWKSEGPWLHLVSAMESLYKDWAVLTESGRLDDPDAQSLRLSAGSVLHTLSSIKSRLRGMSHDSAAARLTRMSELESKISRCVR